MDATNVKMRAMLEKEGLDALLLTKPANQRYLEGFTGHDCYMIVSHKGNFLIADSRYTEMGERECRTAKILPHRAPHPPYADVIAKLSHDMGFRSLGFERDHITWGQYDEVNKSIQTHNIAFVPTSSLIERIRQIKTPEEAAMIGAACQIADRALSDLIDHIHPGVSELDLKIELDYKMKTGGAEDSSFDTMVLFGARASQPHAVSQSDVRLCKGDFILIDYGATKCGYHSDTTRTFVCGKATAEQCKAYETTLKSQLDSLALVAPGVNGKTLNEKALEVITEAGYPAFQYGLGHGVGLEVHELPSMPQKADVTLEPGMVITIEPGIYKPGWGGIRIEDTVIVTEHGHSVLTFFNKELIEL